MSIITLWDMVLCSVVGTLALRKTCWLQLQERCLEKTLPTRVSQDIVK